MMCFFHQLLMLCLHITFPVLFLEFWMFIYYAFWKTEVPSGTRDPAKLYHLGIDWAFRLGKIAENLGICSQIQFVRFLLNLPLAGKESKLLVRNTMFEHVPVRIYQLKCPSTGLLYLHGGYGIFESNGLLRTDGAAGNVWQMWCWVAVFA